MRMLLMVASLVAGLLLSGSARAQEEAAAPEEGGAEVVEESVGLGLTQGKFLLQVIKEVGGEELFPTTLTAADAGLKMADIGLAPKDGWQVNEELTREDLETAYERLLSVVNKDQEGYEPPDIGEMTIADLIDSITEAVREALKTISTERQPVSPTRPLWR